MADDVDKRIVRRRDQPIASGLTLLHGASCRKLTYRSVVLLYRLTQMNARGKGTCQAVMTQVGIDDQRALAGQAEGVCQRHDDKRLALRLLRAGHQQHTRIRALNAEPQLSQKIVKARQVGRLRVEEEIPGRVPHRLGKLRNNSNGRYTRCRLEARCRTNPRIAKLFYQYKQSAQEKSHDTAAGDKNHRVAYMRARRRLTVHDLADGKLMGVDLLLGFSEPVFGKQILFTGQFQLIFEQLSRRLTVGNVANISAKAVEFTV